MELDPITPLGAHPAMTLADLLSAFTDSNGQIDLSDSGAYPDADLADLRGQAINSGLELGADQLDLKRQYLAIATAITTEQNTRAIAAQNNAQDVQSIDDALSALDDDAEGPVEDAMPNDDANGPADGGQVAAVTAADEPAADATEPVGPPPASSADIADTVAQANEAAGVAAEIRSGNMPPADSAAPAAEVDGEPAPAPAPDAPADPAADTATDPESTPEAPADGTEAPAPDAPADDVPADQATETADAAPVAAADNPAEAPNATDPAESPQGEPNMSTATDDRVGALETQLAALTEQLATTRLASVSVGDAPGQIDQPAPSAARVASMTIMSDDGEHQRTLDSGILGARLASLNEQNAGVHFNKVVATVARFEEGTPGLKGGAGAGNTELLFNGTESRRAARTASSMNCGPVSRIETIPQCFVAVRPLADRITNKWPLETMKYEFYRSLSISDATVAGPPSGVQLITESVMNAINPADSATWKQCTRLDCDSVETVQEQGWAVWSCLILNEFQNFTVIPIAENRINLLAVQTARLAESQLLARLRALSYQYTAVAPLGAEAGLLEVFDASVVGYEWTDRLADITWTPIIPRGLARALATDHANRAFNTEPFDLNKLFTDRGYNTPIVVFDDMLGASSPQWTRPGAIGGAAITLPTMMARSYRVYLVDMDSIHMGQRNVISLRELRDLELTRQNEYAMVMETAESLGRHGCVAPISIDVTLCPSGARAALVTYVCSNPDYDDPAS